MNQADEAAGLEGLHDPLSHEELFQAKTGLLFANDDR